MKTKVFIRTVVILFILALNIGCDQVSKSIVRNKMEIYDQYTFLHRRITLQRTENTGAFLGLGDSLSGSSRVILLNILPLIAVVFGLVFILTKTSLNRVTLFGVIMIVGGGAGNLYDRIVHGSVTDFMHIKWGIFQTGVFNVADMSIMTGVFIILIHAWINRKPNREGEEIPESTQI